MFYVFHGGAWAGVVALGVMAIAVLAFVRMLACVGRATTFEDGEERPRLRRNGPDSTETDQDAQESGRGENRYCGVEAGSWECPRPECGAMNRAQARFCRMCGLARASGGQPEAGDIE